MFWLFPANLLVYGVNDIFDYQGDRHNPKKEGYEHRLAVGERRELGREIALFTVPFFPMLFISGRAATAALYGFLGLAIAYSAPPIRAKTKPFVDSLCNGLYVLPGIFGYLLLGGTHLNLRIVAAAVLWCMAMHAYSAVPDIAADRAARLRTTATTLGFYGTLVWCGALFVVAAALVRPELGHLTVLAGASYATLMVVSLFLRSENRIMTLYKAFPLVNAVIGGAIFFSIIGKF